MGNKEAIKKIIDFAEGDFTRDISTDSIRNFFGELSDDKFYSILNEMDQLGYIKANKIGFRGQLVIYSLKITPEALNLFPNKERNNIKKLILRKIYELSGEIIDKNVEVSAFENDFLELNADLLNIYLLELESEGYAKTLNTHFQGIPVVYEIKITLSGKLFLKQ